MRTITNRTSACVRRIYADPLTGEVSVTYKGGSIYDYTNVNRLAILNLMLNKNISLGFWVNKNLLNNERVVCYAMPC
jgi:hypothetical protein